MVVISTIVPPQPPLFCFAAALASYETDLDKCNDAVKRDFPDAEVVAQGSFLKWRVALIQKGSGLTAAFHGTECAKHWVNNVAHEMLGALPHTTKDMEAWICEQEREFGLKVTLIVAHSAGAVYADSVFKGTSIARVIFNGHHVRENPDTLYLCTAGDELSAYYLSKQDDPEEVSKRLFVVGKGGHELSYFKPYVRGKRWENAPASRSLWSYFKVIPEDPPLVEDVEAKRQLVAGAIEMRKAALSGKDALSGVASVAGTLFKAWTCEEKERESVLKTGWNVACGLSKAVDALGSLRNVQWGAIKPLAKRLLSDSDQKLKSFLQKASEPLSLGKGEALEFYCNTASDGACALHAFFGEIKGGKVYFTQDARKKYVEQFKAVYDTRKMDIQGELVKLLKDYLNGAKDMHLMSCFASLEEKVAALREKVDKEVDPMRERLLRGFFDDGEVIEKYLQSALDSGYYFSDCELGIAGYLFDKEVYLLTEMLAGEVGMMIYGSQGCEKVYIASFGSHYSRLELSQRADDRDDSL